MLSARNAAGIWLRTRSTISSAAFFPALTPRNKNKNQKVCPVPGQIGTLPALIVGIANNPAFGRLPENIAEPGRGDYARLDNVGQHIARPTDGSWLTSPTRITVCAKRHGLEQMKKASIMLASSTTKQAAGRGLSSFLPKHSSLGLYSSGR